MRVALSRLKYYIQIGWYCVKIAIQQQTEYPLFLVGWLLANPLQFFFGLLTIYATVSSFGAINGWSFHEIAFLYGISIISHGLSVVLFIQTWYCQYLVLEGEFDRMLVRPLNVIFQFLVMDFNLIGLTDMMPGLVIFFYGWSSVGFAFSVANIFKMGMVIIGATLIHGATYTAIASISFYAHGGRPLIDISMTLDRYATLYPLTLYPRPIQAIFTFILPIGFLSFYPCSEFIGQSSGMMMPYSNLWAYTLIVGVVAYSLAMILFYSGLRRYESAGS